MIESSLGSATTAATTFLGGRHSEKREENEATNVHDSKYLAR